MTLLTKFITVFCLFFAAVSCNQKSHQTASDYSDYNTYDGGDLGVAYCGDSTVVKLWSPQAQQVSFRIYDVSIGGQPLESFELKLEKDGIWKAVIAKDIKNKYYTFQIKHQDQILSEEVDPYAKAVGVNGKRGMIVDMADTNPDNWENDQRPYLKSFNDIVLYELQVRDYSISQNSGIANKGKFLGLSETGTKNSDGLATGLDHIAEMGVTHVHLLPSFDFRSIDETVKDNPKYNWGYDPQNYNVPEGSFSTDPYDGRVRIKEFKKMVQAFHQKGLRVVLDVVYNHTGFTQESNFEQLIPGYFYRHWKDGNYSNSSGCGNETASEKEMVRRFIVESVLYWAKEYHIDGFRFDLMGIHDIETMKIIDRELKEYDPSIFIYGEGWTAGDSPLPIAKRAIKVNSSQLDRIAVFSDDIRDGIKGSWNSEHSKGYVSGNLDKREDVKFGIVASTSHSQIDFSKVDYSDSAYSKSPLQTINYVSCHDNHTLFDKLQLSNPGANYDEIKRLHKLSNTIVFLAQGVPFLHAGAEMCRSKYGVENSFESPDSINQIDWSWKTQNIEHVNYYKDLIRFRKEHPAFKMSSTAEIQSNLSFDENTSANMLVYSINGSACGDSYDKIMVCINAADKDLELPLDGKWKIALRDHKFYFNAKEQKTVSNKVNVERKSVIVLFQ